MSFSLTLLFLSTLAPATGPLETHWDRCGTGYKRDERRSTHHAQRFTSLIWIWRVPLLLHQSEWKDFYCISLCLHCSVHFQVLGCVEFRLERPEPKIIEFTILGSSQILVFFPDLPACVYFPDCQVVVFAFSSGFISGKMCFLYL